MASDYTAHYHLDKYVATDKPNLRDQYNSAMDKVDDALYTADINATDAKAAAQQAQQAVAGKASQSDLNALSQTVSGKASQSDLNALAQNVSKREFNNANKKIVCIGDSLTRNTFQSITFWPEFLHNMLGCSVYNFGVGGSGFARTDKNFTQQLNEAHGSSAFNDADITDVFIVGGFNDINSSADDYYSAVAHCIQLAQQYFYNAIIHIGSMLHGTRNLFDVIDSETAGIRCPKISTTQEAAMRYGAVWIDGCWNWCVGKTGFDHGDGVHINQYGHQYVAGLMLTHLLGGSTDRIEYLNLADPNINGIGSFSGAAIASGGIVSIFISFRIFDTVAGTPVSGTLATLPPAFASHSLSGANNEITSVIGWVVASGGNVQALGKVAAAPNENHQEVIRLVNLTTPSATNVGVVLTYPFGI